MFLVGLWASGVGYGFLPPLGKDSIAQHQWLARFKILGPMLVVIALVLAGTHYFGVTA
jgi:hypothetical protein